MTPAPEAFKRYNQFILWGQDKKPLDYRTLIPGNPHDPANWLDYETANNLATMMGYGVGFVFTDQDPFFFLDIDKALDGQTWSPLAIDLCQRFEGCAVEISCSGRGLHIFGTGPVPAHACKDTKAGLELYTSLRFAALTGNSLMGDADYNPAEALELLVATHFPLDTAPLAATPANGPSPEWQGPTDDEELIRRMLASKSAGSILGGKASLAALWTADAAVLANVYPAQSSTYPFDHSSADAALCAHLAFWTGRDHARMDRLFRMSGLYRDKWERNDYRKRTVESAISRCKEVLGGNKPPVSAPATETNEFRTGFQFLSVSQQPDYFKGCVYVRDIHRVFTPDGALIKQEQFKAMYGGFIFAMDDSNHRQTRNAWEVFTESQGISFPKVHATCFRPELPSGTIVDESGETLVNVYSPIATPRKKGDATPFLQHLEKLIPNERDRVIILSYMAACVQYIGTKFQWCPLIQGCEGNGKTLLSMCLAEAIGWKYTHFPNSNDLANKFNSWILNKLFIGVEEIYVSDKKEAIEALKPMITNPKIEIQGKGSNQTLGDNRANFFMCTNHKDAIRKTRTDRRYCVFYSAQQTPEDMQRSGFTGEYFPRMYRWLRAEGYAIITDFLMNYRIQPEFNPADLCHRAPVTSSTSELMRLSMGGLEQEILEAVEEGTYGFCNGWISSAAFGFLIKERKDDKRIPPNKRRQILEEMGYIPHPGLPEGRANMVIPREAGKPRLYIKRDNPAVTLTDGLEIIAAYMTAQESII